MKRISYLLIAAMGVMLFACYPGTRTISESDLVITANEKGKVYKGEYRTYYMDSVRHIVSGGAEIDTTNDDKILALVRKNFNALGWQEIADPNVETPDVYIVNTSIKAKNTGSYVWGGYPWYGPGYGWWGGWYPYYPYYPSVGYYSYQTGSLLIEMLDVKNADPIEERIGVIWNGAAQGLLEGSYIQSRAENLINQIFTQSPYLNIK
jgi:Domain of unknown function (DUF4136)